MVEGVEAEGETGMFKMYFAMHYYIFKEVRD